MPHVTANGAQLYVEEAGQGPPLVLVHGLGFSGQMFEDQLPAFRGAYRTITIDLRGHGRSELTRTGYDMDNLAVDVAAVIEALGAAPCHFVGWSIGGFIGLRLAARRPELLRSLVIIGAADISRPDLDLGFKIVPWFARLLGTHALAGEYLKTMFTPELLADPARAEDVRRIRRRFVANRRLGIARMAEGVIAQRLLGDELATIRVPTLAIIGARDRLVPRPVVQRTIDRIAGGKVIEIPGSAHACNIETPAAVNAAIGEFLTGLASARPRAANG
jgi:pimeloyl-ACP methyl ester carboxylesterase